MEDFWLDDYDDDDENSDDEAINLDNGLIGDNGGDEDEADFPFRRKTKKNKTIESSNKSTTKQREIVGGKSYVQPFNFKLISTIKNMITCHVDTCVNV